MCLLDDDDAREIVDESYQRVSAILTSRRAELERIAEALIDQETLDRNELEHLLSHSSRAEAA
jgi:ATP-dependent Zn protease